MASPTQSDSQRRLLFVDDEASMRELAMDFFDGSDFEVETASGYVEATQKLSDAAFSVVVTDLNLGSQETGIDICQRSRSLNPDMPVIVTTAFGDVEHAIDAIRAGAYDFIRKPVDFDQLEHTLNRAVEYRELQGEVQRLRSMAVETMAPGTMLGESPQMLRVYDLIERLSRTDVSVLIRAETGCGKELAARAVHASSQRSSGPFIPVNVAAIPETLLESELFGHKKGAFTGATQNHDGLFVSAEGGTLFLDEIGEMPMAMQVKLLRALEEHRVRPVGASHEIEFDARVVAATHRDLEQEIADGNFREDLFYRLNVVTLSLPPLRDRGQDVLLLAQHFAEEFANKYSVGVSGLHATVAARILEYPWPGNVRELRNAIERGVALAQSNLLVLEDLPAKLRGGERKPDRIGTTDGNSVALVPLEEIERNHIVSVLTAVDQNRTLAAEVLDIDRKTLYRKLKKYEEAGLIPPG